MNTRVTFSSASLQQKLKSYSVCAGSVLAASAAAHSQVVYTDLNPDVVLENTAQTFPFFTSYALDLNNDDTTDFDIIMFSSISSSTNQIVYAEAINPLHSNSIAAKSNLQSFLLSKFQKCDTIKQNNAGAIWSSTGAVFNYFSSSNGQEGWGAVNDFYAGLLLVKNNNEYYGWARFDINGDSIRRIVIKDYAFESTPYTRIVAGFCDVGIDELKNEFSIAPNPSTGKIFINTKNSLKGKTTVIITDVTGKSIFTKTIMLFSGEKISFDLTALNAGLYFITLENASKSITSKWIKQ